jgi:hypothetical protein
MIPYVGEFLYNEPDYMFNDFAFIGTCPACPEQYDVIYFAADASIYQVAYVRLRYGHLYCSIPDVGGKVIYSYDYVDEPFLGGFLDENDRLLHLGNISIKLKEILEASSYGYS